MELAVNKWWEIVRGNQGSVSRGPQKWWDTGLLCLDSWRLGARLPPRTGLGREWCLQQGGAGATASWSAGTLSVIPTAPLLCLLLCITLNTSQGGTPGRDTLGCRLCSPHSSEENNIQLLWRCYLFAMFSVPHSGKTARALWIINAERVHSLKVVRGMLIYSKRFTDFNMDSKI